MKSSRRHNKRRQFFDVVKRDDSRRLGRLRKSFGWEPALNLKPAVYKRSPILLIALILLLVGGFYGTHLLFTRAESIDFRPTSCLGTWENPALAQGEVSTSSLDRTNSAFWHGGEGNIFCGNFLPEDFNPRGAITAVGLSLRWKIGEEEASTSGPLPAVNVSTSFTPEATSSLDEILPSSTPKISSSTTPTSFWPWLVPVAVAEETTSSLGDATSDQPVPQVETTTPRIELTPITAPIEDSSTQSSESSTETIISSSTFTPPPPEPDEHFLKISYSVDGSNWEELALISETNWQNLTLPLAISQWENLKNLQIKVESIPTTMTAPPPVYLDSMFIEVQYTIHSFLDLGDTVTPDDVLLLPLALKNSKFPISQDVAEKTATFLNPQYAEIVGPDSYDDRRTIWFGWCSWGVENGERKKLCDGDGRLIIKGSSSSSLEVGLGVTGNQSTIAYDLTDQGVAVTLHILNDGWIDATTTLPLEFVVEYPERFSITDDGSALILDKGHLEINVPHTSSSYFSVATSTSPGYQVATYALDVPVPSRGEETNLPFLLWKEK